VLIGNLDRFFGRDTPKRFIAATWDLLRASASGFVWCLTSSARMLDAARTYLPGFRERARCGTFVDVVVSAASRIFPMEVAPSG
jgi:hypothetical protein